MINYRLKTGSTLRYARGLIPLTVFLFLSAPLLALADSDFNIVGARPLYFGGLSDLAKHYEEKTGINIFAQAGGCKAALSEIKMVSKQSIGAWCCPVPGMLDEKVGIVRIPIAMDAIAVYVHPSNVIENITIDQLRGIYRGEITSWSQLGGPAKPIVPLVRRHCEDLPEVFRQIVVGSWTDYVDKADWLEVKSIVKMIENVKKFPLAIGYESYVFARQDSVKILRVDGIELNRENIRKRRYPFWRVLSLGVHKSNSNNPFIKKFIDFALAPEGQRILEKKLVGISGG